MDYSQSAVQDMITGADLVDYDGTDGLRNGLKMIGWRKPILVEPDSDVIVPETVSEIRRFLKDRGLDLLSKDMRLIGPEWVRPTGEIRGKFPTRVRQYFKKHYGIKVPTEVIEEVGNIARHGVLKYSSVVIDFTNRIDWSNGEFGDEESCYFNPGMYYKPHAIPTIEKNGGLAFRIYDAVVNGRGGNNARAWLIPDCPEPGMALTFNAYGVWHSTLSMVLASFLGCRQLRHQSHLDLPGELHLNSDRFLYGSEEQVKKWEHINVRPGWDSYFNEDPDNDDCDENEYPPECDCCCEECCDCGYYND